MTRTRTRAARTLIKSWRWSCRELCAAISDVRWIWRVHVLIGRYLPSHCRRLSICLLHQLHHDVPAIVRWSSGPQRRPRRRPQRQRRRRRRCSGDCSPVILSSTPTSTTTSTLDLQPLLLTTFQRLFAGRLDLNDGLDDDLNANADDDDDDDDDVPVIVRRSSCPQRRARRRPRRSISTLFCSRRSSDCSLVV